MKKVRLASTVLLIIWSIGATSCKEEVNNAKIEEIPITLSAGIKGVKTRAIDTNWKQNDCIGLHTFNAGTTDFAHSQHNYRYTTQGDGSFNCETESTIYYPLDGSEIDVRGYYPYDATMEDNCLCKVNVSDQSDLAAINLMTFDCYKGASKKKPNVSVTFKHRLTKLIFKIRHEDPDKEVRIKNVLIEGMNTKATFCLFKEKLFIDSNSEQDLNLEVSGSAVEAIVLPREAEAGIKLTFISDEDVEFTAFLSGDQELKAGYKYTFNVELKDKEVPIVIKGIIQDWVEGGDVTVDSHPVIIGQGGGPSTGFKKDDVITLYNDDLEITKFTYNGTKWTPETPLYWENIGDGYSKYLTLRAEFVRTAALHTSQLPEVMLAEITCERFQDINLNFSLVPAKVEFTLKSEADDDSQEYSVAELAGATIVLPNYVTEYTIENGVLDKGTATGTVSVVSGAALILPQEITGTVARVTIGNNTYLVPANPKIAFKEGEITKITVNVTKTGVNGFSASYSEWEWDEVVNNLTALGLTTPGTTNNFAPGDVLSLYYDNQSDEETKVGDFEYQGENKWTTTPPVYWEGLNHLTQYNFYAVSTLRDATANSNQMDDVMYAEHKGVSKFGGINLAFTKKTAKIEVILESKTGTFSSAELASAVVTLPGYTIGAKYNGLTYVPGNSTGSIKADKTTGELKWTALFEPQTITKDETIINININNNNYEVVKKDTDTAFEVAKRYVYKVNISKAGLEFVTGYAVWEPGGEEDIDIELE